MKTHLGNVDAPLKGVLAGPADLLRLEVHGPQSECDKLKEALSPLGCVFYVTEWGFRNAHPQGSGAPAAAVAKKPSAAALDEAPPMPKAVEVKAEAGKAGGCCVLL